MQLIKTAENSYTSQGEPRGYIDPHTLKELWFHTGTACNLECPFCLEGSKPGDTRLQAMAFMDAKPFIDEAVSLGVERLSFTGGEPFVIKQFPKILDYAAKFKPCLILTNGTKALTQRLKQIEHLSADNYDVSFRISIDYPNEQSHDQGRGQGTFKESLAGIRQLLELGFDVSVARQMKKEENTGEVEQQYKNIFEMYGIPKDTHLVAFPDFSTPYTRPEVPEISENCMVKYQTEENRKNFMCAYSKMLVKVNDQIKVFACTLVDDDPFFDLGTNLSDSLNKRILLKHHRCYSCFAYGASCSG